jgi:hypothetical protein
VADTAAYREQAREDREAFELSFDRRMARFEETTRLDIEKHREAADRGNEAFRQSMRESAERFEQGLRQDTEASKRAMDALFEKYAREGRQDRKALNKKWGELANKLGTVAEDVVAPNIPTVARRYFGIRRLDSVSVRNRKRSVTDPETVREFDLVAYSSTHFIVNETKASPTIGDAQVFVALIPSIPDYFPVAVGKELVPIFSSFRIGEDISTYLTRHGVYCMVMRGDTMRLTNFDAVQAARGQP